MEEILKQFPNLSDTQIGQFEALGELYRDWNSKINVISRKDIDNIYTRHILHSLAIAKVVEFNPGAEILDLGTGGGFPGVPLAILYPETHLLLIDGIRKKITVVDEVCAGAGIKNVRAKQLRIEEHRQKHDFIVTRAVARLDKLLLLTKKNIKRKESHAQPNGLLALKGGQQTYEEVEEIPRGNYAELYPVSEYFDDPFFEEKFVVYVQG